MLKNTPDVADFQEFGGLYTINWTGDNEAIIAFNQRMIMAGIPLITIREQETNLEEMFMRITTGAVQ
jgi:hypothetical protein